MLIVKRVWVGAPSLSFIGSPEEFVGRGNHGIETMDSSPFGQVVGRHSLQEHGI